MIDTYTGFEKFAQTFTLILKLDQTRICFAIQKRNHPEQNCSGSSLSLLLPFNEDHLHSTYFITSLFRFLSLVEVGGFCSTTLFLAAVANTGYNLPTHTCSLLLELSSAPLVSGGTIGEVRFRQPCSDGCCAETDARLPSTTMRSPTFTRQIASRMSRGSH